MKFKNGGISMNKIKTKVKTNTINKGMSYYLKDIESFSPLEPKEEEEYIIKIRSGDEEARNMFINRNLRLVLYIARKRQDFSPLEWEDLIQAGNLGLIKAIEKFDPAKGRFSTCAVYWILAYMKRAEENFANLIRRPNYIVQTKTKIKKIQEQWETKFGKQPTPEEYAKEIGCSVKRIKRTLETDYKIFSLNNLVGEEKKDEGLAFFAASDNTEETVINKIMREKIRDIIKNKLSKEEKAVIVMKYFHEDTITNIAKKLNLSKKDIKTIEQNALTKIREYFFLENSN